LLLQDRIDELKKYQQFNEINFQDLQGKSVINWQGIEKSFWRTSTKENEIHQSLIGVDNRLFGIKESDSEFLLWNVSDGNTSYGNILTINWTDQMANVFRKHSRQEAKPDNKTNQEYQLIYRNLRSSSQKE